MLELRCQIWYCAGFKMLNPVWCSSVPLIVNNLLEMYLVIAQTQASQILRTVQRIV